MNNKSPTSPLCFFSEMDWGVEPLSPYSSSHSPPLSLHTHTHTPSLHLPLDYELAAFSASPCVFEPFWHMRSPSVSLSLSSCRLYPPSFTSPGSQCLSVLSCSTQDRKGAVAGSTGREDRYHKNRKKEVGSDLCEEGTAVGQLWLNSFRCWMRKPHQRRLVEERKESKRETCWIHPWEKLKTSTTWGRLNIWRQWGDFMNFIWF